MNRKSWKAPTEDSLKEAYANRGKYPDKEGNRKYIFNEEGDKKIWKVLDKSHKIRLLPMHPDDNINFYGMLVHIHTNVGINGDQFLCLKRMKSENCPICEQQISLWDTEPEMAKTLYPQARYLLWIVDLSQPLNKQIAQIWSCPRTAMDDILGISYKKSTDEILNLADIDDGIVIYFDREKTQGTTFSKYKNFQLDNKVTPVKDDWLIDIVPLSTLLEYATYTDIKNTFLGINNDESKKETVPIAETTSKIEPVKEEVKLEEVKLEESTLTLDEMSREGLEELAQRVLAHDFEEDEIAEMGIKKLRRLVNEAMNKDLKKDLVTDEEEDPKEALKRKLRERVNS